MKFNIIGDNPLTRSLVIDDWYTEKEEKAIWTELDFYSAMPKQYQFRTENSNDVARDSSGEAYSNSFRFYPNSYFNKDYLHISHSFNCIQKVRDEAFTKIVDEHLFPLNRMFYSSNMDDTIITYYDNADYYKKHIDTAFWTLCIWMLKDETKISGGDFIFSDTKEVVKLKHNRAVFFPSFLMHEVEPIKVLDSSDNYGKYTITHFFFYENDKK